MIGTPFGSGFQRGRIELLERRNQIVGGIDYILAAADGKSSDLARPRIEDNHAGSLVEFIAMRDGIGVRSEKSFFFARKQDKANTAARPQARGLDRAQRIDDQRRIASIVERPGAQLPRIEVCSQNHELIRLLVPSYFADYVRCRDRSGNTVGYRKVGADLLP